ncbi:MAG: hypothetical protein HKO66_10725 [Saprospiraceae bacterium]|nr:gliding motility-associated C-terminal domain-containing protein [Bacteroidia bacterium]NNE14492.1 hypothetical protein [Saprospiraceae bacterium]NNL92698.1 hypothetical protein [Saprospiraceae bacterium]
MKNLFTIICCVLAITIIGQTVPFSINYKGVVNDGLSKKENNTVPSLIQYYGETDFEKKSVIDLEELNIDDASRFLLFDPSGKIIYRNTNIKLSEFQRWWTSDYNTKYLSCGTYFYLIQYKDQSQEKRKIGSINKV